MSTQTTASVKKGALNNLLTLVTSHPRIDDTKETNKNRSKDFQYSFFCGENQC